MIFLVSVFPPNFSSAAHLGQDVQLSTSKESVMSCVSFIRGQLSWKQEARNEAPYH